MSLGSKDINCRLCFVVCVISESCFKLNVTSGYVNEYGFKTILRDKVYPKMKITLNMSPPV